jgi:DNA polymerase-3 subunit gamma/tau
MSESPPNHEASGRESPKTGQYTVVARRYRPQTFEELVGQEHVARALSNAISTQRVGHAYLFTGARGVGKTSAARILAKALNCVTGPTPVPCNRCDVCERVSTGDDMDVLEIDGASNRGIDEIRQLRQNVNVRPSRERFKVYIIDEVHMLTREAFNALLKTLEEPPEHVKFILCTTEPAKVPITIVSRCQRFDFAGIQTRAIVERLKQIVEAEGVSAEPEALEVLARRATGSMRDSQSLLEQLLAFAPERITVADVHGMLGTAGEERLTGLLEHVAGRDAAAALADLDAAAQEGTDLGQLLEQLLGSLRDCMVAASGGPADLFLYASPANRERIVKLGKQLGLETILAAMQVLDQALARMRFSTQTRLVAELAVVRICHLEELAELPALIAQLQGGTIPEALGTRHEPPAVPSAPQPAPKKNAELSGASLAPERTSAVSDLAEPPRPSPPAPRLSPPDSRPSTLDSPPSTLDSRPSTLDSRPSTLAPRPSPLDLSPDNATELWSQAVARTSGLAAEHAKHFHRVASPAPDRLVVTFKPGYTLSKSVCERPDQRVRFEQTLSELAGRPVRVEFDVPEEGPPAGDVSATSRGMSPQQRTAQAAQHPMVRRAADLFGAHPVRIDEPPAKT